jgi:phage/plasmid-associated DNA primase
MKRFVLNIGNSNCGKSSQTIAFKQTFGDYIGNWNGQSICVHRYENPDEAQSLRWVLVNRWKRIVFSNEIRASSKINANMIKKLASSDSITARNHGQAEIDFTPHFLPVLFANDLGSIEGADDAVLTRVKVVPFKKEFVDNPETENELKKDYNFENEMKTLRFKQNFVLLMAKHYNLFLKSGKDDYEEPEACQVMKDDYIGDGDNDVINKFLRDFEFSEPFMENFVSNDEMRVWANRAKIKISITKLAGKVKEWVILRNEKYNEIKTEGLAVFHLEQINHPYLKEFQLHNKFEYELQTSHGKKVDKKTKRGWLNVKLKDDNY